MTTKLCFIFMMESGPHDCYFQPCIVADPGSADRLLGRLFSFSTKYWHKLRSLKMVDPGSIRHATVQYVQGKGRELKFRVTSTILSAIY